MAPSDEALVQAWRNGDQAAFATLVERHAAGLLAFLRRRVGQRAEAEDLLQETFRRVIASIASFAPEREFKPWLYAIASNLAVDAWRRRQRWFARFVSRDADDRDGVETEPVDEAPNPAEHAELEERKRLVRQAVAKLPPRQRATLELAWFHGLNYEQVAAAMECSVGTVKTQMSRALHTLAMTLPEPAAGRPAVGAKGTME